MKKVSKRAAPKKVVAEKVDLTMLELLGFTNLLCLILLFVFTEWNYSSTNARIKRVESNSSDASFWAKEAWRESDSAEFYSRRIFLQSQKKAGKK